MTLTEFRQHILKRLGAPVINVEIDTDQMDICIDDTLEKFIEVHYDGLDEGYIFLDVVSGTSEYTLPSTIHSVISIISLSSALISDEPLLVNPYLVGNTVNVNAPSVLDLAMFQQNIAMFKGVMEEGILFEFNSTTDLLTLLEPPTADVRYALRVHASPTDKTDIYSNSWAQKYATALCKIAWASNIGKFEGATLPGGVSLNYQSIKEEGNVDKEALELELYERYQEPIDFFFG